MPHQPYQIGYLMSSPDDLSGPPLRQADPASLNTPADTPETVLADPMPSFPPQGTVIYTQSPDGDVRLAPSPDNANPPHTPGDVTDSNLSQHTNLGAGTAPNWPRAGDTAVTDMGDRRCRSTPGGEDTSDGGTPSPSLPSGEVQEGTQGTVVRLPAPSPITVSSGSSEPGLTRCGPDDPIRGVQIPGVPDDSVASAENALAYLSEELALINTGYGHYYMGGRELALQRYSVVSIETPLLRRAISVITALLDLGIQNETSGAEVGLTTDVFHIHEQLTVPETEAESLQLMAEQLAGKLKGERGLRGGDGNPETIYDAILSKRMANFEACAEAEERLKAAEWTTTLRTRLEGEEFDAFLLSLQKEMEGHEYTVEVRKNFMDNLLNLWTKRREEILRDVESQFREEARMCKEEERRVLKQKLVEEGRVEALRGAEAELTVWNRV
ncbi:hypothetical protein EDB89DRAFT_2077609 [Lactarius sanguifluus]|nr:hypothetical protein EDB89DRAFT_2077609 [Lactarius sanguifluus]